MTAPDRSTPPFEIPMKRCEVCHRVLPLDAFPPDSVICDADYRAVGVDAWEDNDD